MLHHRSQNVVDSLAKCRDLRVLEHPRHEFHHEKQDLDSRGFHVAVVDLAGEVHRSLVSVLFIKH